MKNLIKLIILLVFFGKIAICNAQDINLWLERIAVGENINIPYIAISDFCLKTKQEYADKLSEMRTPEQQEFVNIVRLQRLFFGQIIPKNVISGILNRRTPVLNLYEFDQSTLSILRCRPPRTPKYIAFQFPEEYYDFLGIIQQLVLETLISQKDTRFEGEVTALIDYLCAPIPEDLRFERMYDVDARACYGERLNLTQTALSYLNCCREKSGRSLLTPYTAKQRLISEYGFGKNCHYYDLENWPEFVKKPPTEEEMQRFYEISRQSLEESKKYDKEHEKQSDETFLKNVQSSLQQKDLTLQEREYLEKRINHIKNKKYKK